MPNYGQNQQPQGPYGQDPYGQQGYAYSQSGPLNDPYGQPYMQGQQFSDQPYQQVDPYQAQQWQQAQQGYAYQQNPQPQPYMGNGYEDPSQYQQQYQQYAQQPVEQPVYDPNQYGQQNAQNYNAQPQYQQPRVYVGQTVNPAQKSSAVEQADKSYDKGAKRGGVWRVIFIIALVVLLLALGIAGYIMFSYWNGQHEYDEYTQYMQVDDPQADVITLGSFDVDWDALRAINPDVVGWIYVPDTRINYPIAWRENDDNYYLKKSFGDNSAGDFAAEYGCIMLSGVNQPDFSDEVNIIYGHNMRNGSMFEALSHNLDTEFFNAHRVIYLLTPAGNYRLMSYACDRVLGTSTDIVIPNFPTKEEYLAYVEQRIADSVVTPDPAIPAASSIKKTFALSTCDYPDNHYRVITFCYVNEFLPAGASEDEGSNLVPEGDVASVDDLVNQRVS